ncbi:hypothetical protein NSS76_19455 [Bacillus sp. FSL R5-0654]|nr:hypothetical protein [Bacillus pumilus]
MLDQNSDRIYWVIGVVAIVGTMILKSDTEINGLLDLVFDGFKAKIPKF